MSHSIDYWTGYEEGLKKAIDCMSDSMINSSVGGLSQIHRLRQLAHEKLVCVGSMANEDKPDPPLVITGQGTNREVYPKPKPPPIQDIVEPWEPGLLGRWFMRCPIAWLVLFVLLYFLVFYLGRIVS